MEVDPVDPAADPAADSAATDACRELIGRLPDRIGPGLARRETRPAADTTAAWGDPPVTLRCGVPPPVGFTADAAVLDVGGDCAPPCLVAWYVRERDDAVTYTAVDRTVPVAVRVPREYDAQVLARLAPAVAGLPYRAPSPRPVPSPPR